MRRALVPLLALACTAGLVVVRVDHEASTVVEGAGVLGELLTTLELGGLDDLSLSVEQELANQGIAPGDITEARLVELVLSTPDGEDLSFLTSVSFAISAPDLDTVRIAYGDEFPAGQTSVTLSLDDVDLAPYLVAESMSIGTEAEGELPEDDTTIEADIALDVTATAQGACNAAKR